MTRWIRGRLGRPIASMLFGLMLVSFFLPLAPPQAHAQSAGDLTQLFADNGPRVPVAVVDFNNKTPYHTGMLGRAFADALSMELMQTGTQTGANGSGKFEVVPRQDVEKEMVKNNLSVPMSHAQEAMLAKRLCKFNSDGTIKYSVNFVFSGDIESVRIRKAKEGTTAEVSVRLFVISRVTGMPINGAMVNQTSSPKIGYSGNYDSLVQEALTTAAFQAVMKIMDSRVPIGTILTSPRNGEIVMKGGAAIGFRVGMELTSIRRDSLTGRITLTEVTPNESTGTILDDSRGIAPGDKVLPIFEFTSTARRTTKGAVGQAGLYVAAIAAGAILFSLMATNNNNNSLDTFAAPLAATLADSESLNYPTGANIVRWQRPSQRVVAYIIYRDIAPNVSPIAVVDGSQDYFIDSTTPITQAASGAGTAEESITYTITFVDQTIGDVATTTTTVYDTTVNQGNPAETFSETNYTVTTHRVPLSPGQKTGYQVKVLYMDYLQSGLGGENSGGGASLPQDYSFFLGNKGAVSNRVTVVEPPPLLSPSNDNLPTNGVFSCTTVPSALDYVLQYSTDNKTFTNLPSHDVQVNLSPSTVSLQDQNYATDMQLTGATNVFWRIGAKVDGEATPYALSDSTQSGYVFSLLQVFSYDAPPAGKTKHVAPGLSNGKLPTTSRGGSILRR